jgi:hypothetical protein
MKKIWLILIIPFLLLAKDTNNTMQFLTGDYLLIGKKPDLSVTYSGTISFVYKEEKKELEFIRTINGKKIKGIAKIEKALGGEAEVLRLRFTEDKLEYEGTFLWRSDLDNYGRLSGYIYLKNGNTKTPGLEAYFIKQ